MGQYIFNCYNCTNLKCQHDSIATCLTKFPQINMGQITIFLLMALVFLGHACRKQPFCIADDGKGVCTGPCGGERGGTGKRWCYLNEERHDRQTEKKLEGINWWYCNKHTDNVDCYRSSKSHLKLDD